MFQLLNLLCFYYLLVWNPCSSQYLGGTSSRMIEKIKRLAEELVIDVLSKIESIYHVKDCYAKNSAYQVGDMVYNIRFKYKRMIFLYSLADSQKELSNSTLDAHTDKLVEIDNLAHEIDNLLRMIDMIHEQKTSQSNLPMGGSLRSTNEARLRQRVAEVEYDQPPSVQTAVRGKRRNGPWHYEVENAFNK